MIVDEVVKAVIGYLSSRGRLELLPQIAQELTRAGFNQVDPNLATVTSAVVLSAKQKSALVKTLAKVFKHPIRLKQNLDPDLIGGLRLTIAGKVIDASINRQLTDLKEVLIYD